MDAVPGPLALTAEERGQLSRLAEGDPPNSSRAVAILSLADGEDRSRAADVSGLTERQVSYWSGRFRTRRIVALGVVSTAVEDAPAPQAPVDDLDEGPVEPAAVIEDPSAAETIPSRAKKGKKASGKTPGKGDKKAKKPAAKGKQKAAVKKTDKGAKKPASEKAKQPTDKTGKKAKKPADKPGKKVRKPADKPGKKAKKPAAKGDKKARKPIPKSNQKPAKRGVKKTASKKSAAARISAEKTAAAKKRPAKSSKRKSSKKK